MFEEMMNRVRENTVRTLFQVQVDKGESLPGRRQQRYSMGRGSLEGGGSHGGEAGKQQTVRRDARKVGRNEPCPCGSGKKYKKCCGAN